MTRVVSSPSASWLLLLLLLLNGMTSTWVDAFLFKGPVVHPNLQEFATAQQQKILNIRLDILEHKASQRTAFSLQGPMVRLLDRVKTQVTNQQHQHQHSSSSSLPVANWDALSSGSKELDIVRNGHVIDLTGLRSIPFRDGTWEMAWKDGRSHGMVVCSFDLPEAVSWPRHFRVGEPPDALVGLILFQTLLGPNGEFDKHAARFDLVVIASDRFGQIKRVTRNDNKVEPCRMFIEFPIWTQQGLEEDQAYKRVMEARRHENDVAKTEYMMQYQQESNLFKKMQLYHAALQAMERNTLTPRCEYIPEPGQTVELNDNLVLTKQGTVWMRRSGGGGGAFGHNKGLTKLGMASVTLCDDDASTMTTTEP
eukprot:CAMPEP_0168858394 /NCGR_PEP_ID=MMETSP0727-20121128/16265_1 /TAXON_ID=265536 /ORGANISM="Amphiprora sp., Strain CCMP467" /LENGTH=365 /DNA_ID=CAMNT_0008913137 /DNA_START=159 /DNA_END=1257 /DNA_ORIENTATION=-